MKARTVMARSLLVAVLSIGQASAQTTHYVANLGDCAALVPCHATIMDAVDAAAPFDVIEVFPGVYHEAVVFGVGKNNIVLRAHFGTLMPVIAAPDNAVLLHASGVRVQGFVLEATAGAGVSGDGLPGASGAIIQGNVIRSSHVGISLRPCSSSRITNNRILSGGIALNTWSGDCLVDGNMVDGASIKIGDADFSSSGNTVLGNVVRQGDIVLYAASPLTGNTVEWNRVEGGSITLSAVRSAGANAVRNNVVRGGGGISLGLVSFGYELGSNLIDANFVSGASGGIAIQAVGGQSLISNNTSIESIRCDLSDSALAGKPQNTWSNNRFRTKCGAATE